MATALKVSSNVEHSTQHNGLQYVHLDHEGLRRVLFCTWQRPSWSKCCTIAIYCATWNARHHYWHTVLHLHILHPTAYSTTFAYTASYCIQYYNCIYCILLHTYVHTYIRMCTMVSSISSGNMVDRPSFMQIQAAFMYVCTWCGCTTCAVNGMVYHAGHEVRLSILSGNEV